MADFDPVTDLLNQLGRVQTQDNEVLVNQFLSIAGDATAEHAQFFLEANNFNVAAALGSYFETVGSEEGLNSIGFGQNIEPSNLHAMLEGMGMNGGMPNLSAFAGSPRCEVIGDVTFASGCPVLAGTTFNKCWRLYNSGGSPWPEETSLYFAGGTAMTDVQMLPIGPVPPDTTIDVSIPLVAPTVSGPYESVWEARVGPNPIAEQLAVRIMSIDDPNMAQQYLNVHEQNWESIKANLDHRLALIREQTSIPEQLIHLRDLAGVLPGSQNTSTDMGDS